MGRKVDVDDLVSATEIAERLGHAHRQVVHDWRLRYRDFPTPAIDRPQMCLWEWPAVLAWANLHRKVRT